MTNNLEDLKSRFLEYIEIEKGRSLKTVTNYDRYITRFLEFAATATKKDLKKMNADDLDEKILREYRLFLNRQLTNPRLTRGQKGFGESLKKRTQNYYMIALRSYFKFLAKNKIQTVGADQIELAKVGERELDLITQKELGAILAAPEKKFRNIESTTKSSKDKSNKKELELAYIKALRDRAILETLFSTGLRVSELVSLDRFLDLSYGQTAVRGKGEKVRVVFFSEDAKKSIKKYLDARKDTNNFMFVSHSNISPPPQEKNKSHKLLRLGLHKSLTSVYISSILSPHYSTSGEKNILKNAHVRDFFPDASSSSPGNNFEISGGACFLLPSKTPQRFFFPVLPSSEMLTSISSIKSDAFSEYIEQCKAWASMEISCYIPDAERVSV